MAPLGAQEARRWDRRIGRVPTTEDLTVPRIAEVLREAEGRGLARELAGVWALTEAGHAHSGPNDGRRRLVH